MRIRKRFLQQYSLASDPLLQLQSSIHSQPSDHHKDYICDDVKNEKWSEQEKNNIDITRDSSNPSIQIPPPSYSDQEAREDEKKMKPKTNNECAWLHSMNNDDPDKGSTRCSRMNGRGWRCGRKTLRGYCLCEHHLGKSRLRKKKSQIQSQPLVTDDHNDETRVVKARSISSLLKQTSTNM